MEVSLIAHTPTPVELVVRAARMTRGREDLPPREEWAAYLKRLYDVGHTSVFEHANFTFLIKGISRVCLAQLTRHRIASYSVRSHRATWPDDFVFPSSVTDDYIPEVATKLADYFDAMWEARDALERAGVPREDIRYFFPQGASTSLIMTANARSLDNFFRQRTCLRAQWEIRELAGKMLAEVRRVAPELFPGEYPPCGTCKESECRKREA